MVDRYLFNERQRLNILEGEMRTEANNWKNHYKELSDFILPRRSRFFTSNVNRIDNRSQKILDSTATLSSRTLQSGLMTGVTSPAKPWFKLGMSNLGLMDQSGVKEYLEDITDLLRMVFLRSNLYNILPTCYGDIGTFGTGCVFMEEDDQDIVKFRTFPIGSYMISTDSKGKVNVFFREFEMTVRQVVEKFGGGLEAMASGNISWKNISTAVQNLYQHNQLEARVIVCHVVIPNEEYKVNSIDPKYKLFRSYYYEKSISNYNTSQKHSLDVENKFLRVSGYDYFPALVPRWEVTGEDSYGSNSPGQVALGDVKQLQLTEERILNALDHKVKPPMVGPTNLKNAKASSIPGHITFVDEREGVKGFRRLFEIDFDVRETEMKQQQLRQRISKAYYEDLFLMMAQSDRREITAREIEERHEEKLLVLGPVLERINLDLLDPLIDNTLQILDKRGLLPSVPEELEGADYNVEYISMMAQAQKLSGVGFIERLMAFIQNTSSYAPEILHKYDFEKIGEKYAELLGTPTNFVRSEEEVAERIAAEQQAMAQQQQSQNAVNMANAGKALGDTKIDEGNALSKLMSGDV
jgi:hypothetical protein